MLGQQVGEHDPMHPLFGMKADRLFEQRHGFVHLPGGGQNPSEDVVPHRLLRDRLPEQSFGVLDAPDVPVIESDSQG